MSAKNKDEAFSNYDISHYKDTAHSHGAKQLARADANLSSQFFTKGFSLKTTILTLLITQRNPAAGMKNKRMENMVRSSHAIILSGIGKQISAQNSTPYFSHNQLVNHTSCLKLYTLWMQRIAVAGPQTKEFRQR